MIDGDDDPTDDQGEDDSHDPGDDDPDDPDSGGADAVVSFEDTGILGLDEDSTVPASITITRTAGNLNADLTVKFSVTEGSGTANLDTDYHLSSRGEPITDRVTIPAGSPSGTIDVSPILDDVDENPYEGFSLTLKDDPQTPATYTVGLLSMMTIYIQDVAQRPRAKEISFGGNGFTAVTPDPVPNPENLGRDYADRHWLDANLDGRINPGQGEHQFPVSYARGRAPRISGTFALSAPLPDGATVQVRGKGPGGRDFPATVATASADRGEVTIAAVTESTSFANAVAYHESFEISWEYSTDGGTTWRQAGKTSNPVYVTLGTPRGDIKNYYTTIHVGTMAAAGATDEATVISRIWSQFEGRSISRKDGTPLTYHGNWLTGSLTAQALLRTGDGSRGSWQTLFLSMLTIQGIQRDGWLVTIWPDPQSPNNGFLIKNWEFVGTGNSGSAVYPYLNVPAAPFIMPGTNSFQWRCAEVRDQAGVSGQGTADPWSLFEAHLLVRIDGIFYDPSYGKTYNSLQDMADQVIAGYYLKQSPQLDEAKLGVDLDGDGQNDDRVTRQVYMIQKSYQGQPHKLRASYHDY